MHVFHDGSDMRGKNVLNNLMLNICKHICLTFFFKISIVILYDKNSGVKIHARPPALMSLVRWTFIQKMYDLTRSTRCPQENLIYVKIMIYFV